MRRSRKGGGKSSAYSTLSTGASKFGFKTKKTSNRAFRNALWKDTLYKAHYRSIGGVLNTFDTPANAVLERSVVYNAIDNGTNTTFWLTTGGAQDVDGATVPFFESDITLRGGVCGVHISNVDATANDICSLKVYFGITPNLPSTGGFNSTTRPIGWDPSCFPEFKQYVMKVVLQEWNIELKPGERVTLKRRLGVKKIDKAVWLNSGNRFYWAVVAGNSDSNNAASITFTTFFNVSFSGDAVGTT